MVKDVRQYTENSWVIKAIAQTVKYPKEWLLDDYAYFRLTVKEDVGEPRPSPKKLALSIAMLRFYSVSRKRRLRRKSLKAIERRNTKKGYIYFVAYLYRVMRTRYRKKEFLYYLVFSLSILPVMPLCGAFLAYKRYMSGRKYYDKLDKEKLLKKMPQKLRDYVPTFLEMAKYL